MPTIPWRACGVAALLGGVLAVVLAHLLYFAPRADAAAQALQAATEHAGRVQDANERCATDVEKANGAVATLKAATAERAGQVAAALAQAESRAAAAEGKAAGLARRPPARPADLCGSLDELLTEVIKERRAGR
ncbi:hypothetical protein P3W85_30045 [Cupriavidus basilensis]|uniref:Rz protein n=1 Tax=Cupriavidus basilensis TaxID=68895 RepID=A0ABT6AX14_9BURK|nr:hypothetical protein [Cupriavidus basilensis]MDF3837166.1 hypothetical protein [Cupriavidus basilensis]